MEIHHTSQAHNQKNIKDVKNMDEAVEHFTISFVTTLFQIIQEETVGVDESTGGGHGEDIMSPFLIAEYAKKIKIPSLNESLAKHINGKSQNKEVATSYDQSKIISDRIPTDSEKLSNRNRGIDLSI